MSNNPLKLKIAYLYPDILDGICDRANIEAFCRRAKWRDIDVSVIEIMQHEKITASRFDFYYIGGSNVSELETALKSLNESKDELHIAASASVPMLAVNCGYQLFGNYYQLHNKTRIDGIKLLDVDSVASKQRHYGNIIGTCNFLKNKTIVGFENHGIISYLRQNASPFLLLQKGKGNNGKDKTEGARFNNVVGTYITSALLAQNPHLCDFFLSVALRIKYKCKIPLAPLIDDVEWYSHNYILENS